MPRLHSLGTHLARRGGNEQEGKASQEEGWPVTRGWHSELCGPQGQAGIVFYSPEEFGKRDFPISYKLETTDVTQPTTEILPRGRSSRMVGGTCFR